MLLSPTLPAPRGRVTPQTLRRRGMPCISKLLEEGECPGKTGPFIGFFILDFIRCFVLHAPPAGLRDKVQDKVQDKARDAFLHASFTRAYSMMEM